MTDYAEVYRDDNGEWRWRVKAGNHETVASGEGYHDKRDALAMLASRFPTVPVVELHTVQHPPTE